MKISGIQPLKDTLYWNSPDGPETNKVLSHYIFQPMAVLTDPRW